MISKSISVQNLLSVISFALLTQTMTINMNLVGNFKVRQIAGHEPDWNHATSKNNIPSSRFGVVNHQKFYS